MQLLIRYPRRFILDNNLQMVNTSKLVRSLYRSLLKSGKRLDASPASKATIYISPSSHLDDLDDAASKYYHSIIEKVVDKSHYMSPERCQEVSLSALVRKEFRSCDVNNDVGLDVAIFCVKKMSMLTSVFNKCQQSITKPDGSSSREGSHNDGLELNFLEKTEKVTLLAPGTLLVAHPMMEGSFRRSVILILEHSDRGSYGLVINKSTDYSLEGVVRNFPADIMTVFGAQPVQYGGPVRRLQYVHPVKGVAGALEVPGTGLFYGGAHKEATEAAKAQTGMVDNFQFFAGCCTWRPEQLQKEVDFGCWFTCKSTEYEKLLKTTREATRVHLQDLPADSRDDGGLVDGNPMESMEAHTTAIVDGRDFDDHTGTWPRLMRALGEPYSTLSWIPSWFDTSVIESCDWK
jgi:putative transcriptional regulator